MNHIQLSTHKLSVGFGNKVILEHLDLEIKSGELVCLMGPNGSGKTTLLHTLAGLIKPISGEISLNKSESLPKLVSVVLTDKNFHPDLTGMEMVMMGRYPHQDWLLRHTSKDSEVVGEAIHKTGITHLINLRNHQMSDGQRQMVMVARALAQDTPLLIMDEPTSHLDLNNRVEVMNLLKTLAHEKGKSILIATHELDLALQTADQVWLANRQRKIKTGVPEDLVLDGSIDDVFQLKGFTLKTGKVDHLLNSAKTVRLSGSGYAFLWTKNALERQGIQVDESGETSISISEKDGKITWIVGGHEALTISGVLDWIAESGE